MNLLPVFILAICFAAGMPVAYALILSTIPYFIADPYIAASVIVQRVVSNAESVSLMAVPFFIFAGSVMSYCGVTSRLMRLASLLVGHLTGGLGQVNIVLSALMGGISGSGAADAAVDCKLLVPEMERYGYSRAYSGAVTAASACITPIIPPGVGLVVFAVVCECSVGKLMCSGYIPGLMMTFGMMLLNKYICNKRNFQVADKTKKASKKDILEAFVESIPAMVIPFGLILGLRFGAFTATEGGALIAMYSVFIGAFVYKDLKLKHIWPIIKESVYAIGPVMLVLCSASVFSYYLSFERIPQTITTALISMSVNKYVFLLMINLLMLVLGMFLDGMACMMIIAPLLAPVATALGINIIHFGIVMVLNCAIGAITPPFGTYIFLVAGTIKVKTSKLIRELIPFIGVCLIVLLLITYIPWLVTFVPKLVYGSV